jgi:3-isopropylmalate/(R)-2-methylmalate dehydratase small subunit
MPCVTAEAATLEALMAAVEADPALELEIDLERSSVALPGQRFPVALPAGARESFLDGTWDATGLLLDRFEEVEAVAKRLPYVVGWS